MEILSIKLDNRIFSIFFYYQEFYLSFIISCYLQELSTKTQQYLYFDNIIQEAIYRKQDEFFNILVVKNNKFINLQYFRFRIV